jgi:hypothetical protein
MRGTKILQFILFIILLFLHIKGTKILKSEAQSLWKMAAQHEL